MMVFVYIGQLLAIMLPNEAAAGVFSGLVAVINSNFCGFLIKAQDFPSFWTFMYWLDPLHYALEGLTVTQFHNDKTPVTTFDGITMTAEEFIGEYYSTWKYSHRGFDAMALLLFVVVLR